MQPGVNTLLTFSPAVPRVQVYKPLEIFNIHTNVDEFNAHVSDNLYVDIICNKCNLSTKFYLVCSMFLGT